MQKLMILAAGLFLISCGSGASSERSAEQTATEEKAIVDSVTTAVDSSIKTLEQETQETSASIDSLLSDI